MSADNRRERATEIRTAAETEPGTVDIDILTDLLIAPTKGVRRIAFDACQSLVSAQPAAVDDIVTQLETHLVNGSAKVRRRAALTTGVLVEEYPESIDRLAPPLRSIGNDPAEPGREAAIVALSKLAFERPAAVAPEVDTLLSICLDPVSVSPAIQAEHEGPYAESEEEMALRPERERRDQIRLYALAALTQIATDEPAALRMSTSLVAPLLEDDNNLIRAGACELLEPLASTYPSSVESFAPELAERAASDTKHPVPWRAADALVALDEKRPKQVGDAVAPFASDFSRFLESRDSGRRRTGIALLTDAAIVRPESIEPMLPTLRDLLGDDDSFVRTNATIVLGAAGDETDRSAIADLAETDPDGCVRETAARVLEQFVHPREDE
ncbi:HEAT repeat domain-containing protein [Natronorubrum halophilum]|uniref:HEAT repeat domain-containing protein n=1 Tax=Natronorubrum halophilum TaxID=1702106 RepID=UPI0010C1E8A1|nr:HEAT repeat domain-containing protein [Natronorubrum halophilum]